MVPCSGRCAIHFCFCAHVNVYGPESGPVYGEIRKIRIEKGGILLNGGWDTSIVRFVENKKK